MTVKYIGMALVLIFTTLVGNGLAIAEKRRIEQSEALRALIAHITREIECFKTPLDSIFSSFSNKILERIGFLDKVTEGSLKVALSGSENLFCFKEETCKKLLGFADFLGKSDSADQISRCKYVLSLIDDDIKKSRDQYPKNRKMYSSLGVLFGIMIIILLV